MDYPDNLRCVSIATAARGTRSGDAEVRNWTYASSVHEGGARRSATSYVGANVRRGELSLRILEIWNITRDNGDGYRFGPNQKLEAGQQSTTKGD